MSTVLIIGAGGVGSVVAHKCAQRSDVFTRIVLASRTLARCEKIRASIRERSARDIEIEEIDADDVERTSALIERVKPDLLLNVALPYQDLALMDACLATGTDYLDTANYEPPDEAKFEYKWQWAYRERFESAGLMALLGSGFDPGVTNVFCAYAQQKLFDVIHEVDIVDCNGGDHGKAFATNFNPEINIREITQRGRYWQDGTWQETEPLSVAREFDFPEVGVRKAYLMYHEELESLALNLPGLKRIRFWMTFGEAYLNHLRVLEGIGMTRIDPIDLGNGVSISPLQFLKKVLPDPSSLATGYEGKTCIGCIIHGVKDGRPRRVFIYNVCDHAVCNEEVGSQAVSYTTGVPAMVGAMMMLKRTWHRPGVHHMEQFEAAPFLEHLAANGLPWQVVELDPAVDPMA